MTAQPDFGMMQFEPSDRPRIRLIYVPAYDENTENVRAQQVEIAMMSPIESLSRNERKQLGKAFEGCLKLLRDLQLRGYSQVSEAIEAGEISEKTYLGEEES